MIIILSQIYLNMGCLLFKTCIIEMLTFNIIPNCPGNQLSKNQVLRIIIALSENKEMRQGN